MTMVIIATQCTHTEKHVDTQTKTGREGGTEFQAEIRCRDGETDRYRKKQTGRQTDR